MASSSLVGWGARSSSGRGVLGAARRGGPGVLALDVVQRFVDGGHDDQASVVAATPHLAGRRRGQAGAHALTARSRATSG